MRTFIAIELEEEIKEYVAQVQEEVKNQSKKGNFTPKENFHMTLHFVGETTVEDIEFLKQAIFETALRNRNFSLVLNRLGFFPRGDKAIAWVGVKESKELSRLFHLLEKNLSKEGFARDKKGLNPHITIGREVVLYRSFQQVEKNTKIEKKTISVQGISLMESVRIGSKLIYRPLFQQKFQDNDNQ